jgi:hypothetical protein
VDQTLPIAETAAAYDIGLVNHVNFQDLAQQQGFVVFVSGNAAVRNHWLTPVKQPSGWPPRFLEAQVFQLPGPGVTPVDASGAGSVADGSTGGARVVVASYSQDGNGATPHSQMVTLVREFMLGILAAHNQALANGLPAIRVPSWPQEGLAVAVQDLFEANTNPAPAKYDFSRLTAGLRSLPASYKTGALPVRGSSFTAPRWPPTRTGTTWPPASTRTSSSSTASTRCWRPPCCSTRGTPSRSATSWRPAATPAKATTSSSPRPASRRAGRRGWPGSERG